MKYKLIEWPTGLKSIYEYTDDMELVRYLWNNDTRLKSYVKLPSSWMKNLHREDDDKENPFCLEKSWLSKEEAFTIML